MGNPINDVFMMYMYILKYSRQNNYSKYLYSFTYYNIKKINSM